MPWPFDRGGAAAGWLALYLATLALHAAFIGYVVAGTARALIGALRRDDPDARAITEAITGALPFMLGCGITAGVAPLLFLQLLYQRRFYTANLLLGPRWMAVIPALVIGFYLLYLAKAVARRRALILAGALGCFGFVAWSWTELHLLMEADAQWRAFYAAGARWFVVAALAPRLVLWAGAMAASFALIAAWQLPARAWPGLARIALGGRLACLAAGGWLAAQGGVGAGPVRAWLIVVAAALLVEGAAWLVVWRHGDDDRGLTARSIATAAGVGALVAATVVREAPRLALIEVHDAAIEAGGAAAFVIALVIAGAAIAWIVRTARASHPAADASGGAGGGEPGDG